MLTIVIGASGLGKSTVSKHIAQGRKVISAGGWIRERMGIYHHGDKDPCRCRRCRGESDGPPAVELLSAASKVALLENPNVCIEWIRSQMGTDRNVVLEGVRNPRDLFSLILPGDHVLDLGGEGASEFERQGLTAIRASRAFLESQLSVTWAAYKRHFCTLPCPLSAAVETRFLFGDGRLGTLNGHILAFESYEGDNVTVCWKSLGGGTFHDLPLEAFHRPGWAMGTEDAVEYFRAHPVMGGDSKGRCYAPAGPGAPVLEVPPQGSGKVSVFDRERQWVGVGASLWMMHWPEGNQLLHLIELESQLLLWPPHKLLWDENARELPAWKKLRHPPSNV